MTEIREPERVYISSMNLNFDLLRQALSLENHTQNNREAFKPQVEKLTWKLGQLTGLCLVLKSTGKVSKKDTYIPLGHIVFCRSPTLELQIPFEAYKLSSV